MDEQQKPQVWSPETSLTIKTVGNVRVSPDGRRVAYTITEPVMTEEKSEFLTRIWLADADGANAHPATFGEKSSADPRWSPHGEALAFTSRRKEQPDKDEKNGLYLLRMDGGEAELLTDSKADVGAFRWSPDGSQIAFLMPDPPTEEEEKRKKARDDWHWKDEDIKFHRLYVLPVQKDPEGKREARLLTQEGYQVGNFDWSPDGRHIVYEHTLSPSADHWMTSDLSKVEVATGQASLLLGGSRAAFQPCFSPDGATLAFVLSDDPPRWYFSGTLHLLPAGGGDPTPLAVSFDERPTLIGWSQDGKQLYFEEPYHTTNRLYSLQVETKEIQTLYSGGMNAEFSLNASRTHFGFTHQTTDLPVEAFVASVPDFKPHPVSRANAGRPDLPLGRTEVIRWPSADGREIEGLLTYPVGYQQGRRVPLLLVIHGGPAGVFQENFTAAASVYPVASFAAKGYAVLRCNPRGSSGYGKDFRAANLCDWGGRDYEDLMHGVDTVIATGVADPERLGVMGWSYGGFMTSWIITQTHRFKAASVGAAVTNLMSFNGTADIPGFVPDYFGAQSWENLETYCAHSAMFQVKGVTTPALIQHGDQDIRVPISQGYEFYNALKQQGVETRMIVFPRQPHGLTEPRMQLKAAQTNLEWFDGHLSPPTP